eukprot:2764931-Pleurochrysis_carterae.AAC.1
MPCSLVKMLQVGVRRDVPSFQWSAGSGRGAVPTCGPLDDKCCNDALQAGLAQNDDFRLNLHVERREMMKSNRSVAQRVLNVVVEADRHRRYHVLETPVRCTATAVALRACC